MCRILNCYYSDFWLLQEITTLKEYVTSVMRPHTLHMRRQLSAEATGNSSSDVCSVGGTLDISYSVSEKYLTGLAGAVPGYIFSGVQQVSPRLSMSLHDSLIYCTPTTIITTHVIRHIYFFFCLCLLLEFEQGGAQADDPVGTALYPSP